MAFSSDYFRQRRLLGIEGLSVPAIHYLLDLAAGALDGGLEGALEGLRIVDFGFGAAPGGFARAGRMLSATVEARFCAGERPLGALADEVAALRPDIVAVRSAEAGVAARLARASDGAVINAGDGAHEDPATALAAAVAIRRSGRALEGAAVALCGDVLQSGAARSLLILLSALGARPRLVGPTALTPEGFARMGFATSSDARATLGDADIVIGLPLAASATAEGRASSARDHAQGFALSAQTLALAPPGALALDGAAFAAETDDGVAARMAILAALARNLSKA